MRRILRILRKTVLWLFAAIVGLIALLFAALFVSSLFATIPGQQKTPSGLVQDRALYLTARDGTRLAADIWLPADYRAGQKLPTVLHVGRYWRDIRWSWLVKGAHGLGLFYIPDTAMDTHIFLEHGYAVVLVDTRGSGASEGASIIPFSPQERNDIDDIATWIAKQPWSNGRIGAVGVSYAGNLAEMAAATGNPAIKAVAPLYVAFDDTGLFMPGGVKSQRFAEQWQKSVRMLDANDVCIDYGLKCRLTYGLAIGGVKPVDADADGRELAAIVAHRRNTDVGKAVAKMTYADDLFGNSGLTLAGRSAYANQDAVEKSGVPMLVFASWYESQNAAGALARYLSFANPQEVHIGAWSHGGRYDADPFSPATRAPVPSEHDQWLAVVKFFDATVKPEQPKPFAKRLFYSTIGAGQKFRKTEILMAPDTRLQMFLFEPDRTLAESAPELTFAEKPPVPVAYTVDFSATTGEQNRWHTTATAAPVVYPDRRREDRKLLTFTGAPLSQDTEITGTPVVTLNLVSSREDGAFFVYLEDVAPDGRVTYLTEGLLRGSNRKRAAAPYVETGPYHSGLRRDAEAMPPGEPVQLEIALNPISAVIRQGHRIRLSLAGADAGTFERIPANGTPVWRVMTGSRAGSFAVIPTRPWTK